MLGTVTAVSSNDWPAITVALSYNNPACTELCSGNALACCGPCQAVVAKISPLCIIHHWLKLFFFTVCLLCELCKC